eukprot:CAMPEP_0183315822 /NCGR_PEP_ID=MMETSP0160_2-20130417/52966_1 /TAXON_ID=2839 ORGANISM="Odontella Sinensis, Strain Grunow 1884" /NCGR_SAMPLE_ID=MMETSP0160_2 /ASSEMBLY_ACC=CAM_ASM_000250 /LENGTH=36 /DNA_ID= /DNA_START= /DNA_END= /DNA_ORIENTATION=
MNGRAIPMTSISPQRSVPSQNLRVRIPPVTMMGMLG